MIQYLLALTIPASLALGFWLGMDHVKANQADADIAHETMQSTVAKAIADKMPAQQKIIERITRETIETPVYAECRHSAGGLRDINAAITDTAGTVAVPDADTP